jgi:hypothetical protein
MLVQHDIKSVMLNETSILKYELIKNFLHFLIVQYGSSVQTPVAANDIDFLVLVYGDARFDGSLNSTSDTYSRKVAKYSNKSVDISIRSIESFYNGLTQGKPYEISVALDGVLRESNQLSPECWVYFQNLVKHTTVNTSSLKQLLHQETIELFDAVAKSLKEKKDDVVVFAYHYLSHLLQIKILCSYPGMCSATYLYSLAKPRYLEQKICSNRVRELYREFVTDFKCNRRPNEWISYKQKFNLLIGLVDRIDLESNEI